MMNDLGGRVLGETELEELKRRLLAGEGGVVEEEIFRKKKEEAGKIYQKLVTEITNSEAGREIARKLTRKHNYDRMRKKEITVTIQDGHEITIPSYYAIQKGKKKGPRKKGPNGRGIHVLLSYWGYQNKYSPRHVDQVARCGVGSASYDLAEAELQAQGIAISSKKVDHIVQIIGAQAQALGTTTLLASGETLAGKRVIVSLDGGRIRSREKKTGRPKKEQKQIGFTTPWREPKLFVIAEIDATGKKKKGTKPLYEATMKSSEEVYKLLTTLWDKLQIDKAAEVVCINDGGTWIWNLFSRLIMRYPQTKITGVVDFFHAAEHITELSQAHTKKSIKEQKRWANHLQALLRAGAFTKFKETILEEAERENLPELAKQFSYFEKLKDYMHYDSYEAAQLPIGSGIVESAIKRVINQRIKSPGSFWKIENVEKLLHLRCALMAGRWQICINNIFASTRLSLAI